MNNKVNFNLEGKTVVITGAGGLLGRAMALEFARNGATVMATDRNAETLEETRKAVAAEGGKCETVVADILIDEDIEKLFNATMEKCGGVNVLINNAGVTGGPDGKKNLWEYDDKIFREIISTDLRAPYYVSKPFAKVMVEQGDGAIINISSVAGVVPAKMQCAYAAAKGGIINMTKAMGLELGGFGVRCNAIAPGITCDDAAKERFFADKENADMKIKHIPLHRTGEPWEVASLACYLASDAAKFINSQVYSIDGGFDVGFARDF